MFIHVWVWFIGSRSYLNGRHELVHTYAQVRCLRVEGEVKFVWVLLAVFSVAISAAQAQTASWSSPNFRPLSGPGSSNTKRFTTPQDRAIIGLAVYERRDRPIEIRLTASNLCHYGTPTRALGAQNLLYHGPTCDYREPQTGSNPETEHRLRTNGENGNRRLSVFVGGPFSVRQGDRFEVNRYPQYYITGIQVCTNLTNRRIKGLRVWRARLEDSGVERVSQYVQDRSTNCVNWHDRQDCVGNRIMVGLRAHYSDEAFHGIEMRCARVDT